MKRLYLIILAATAFPVIALAANPPAASAPARQPQEQPDAVWVQTGAGNGWISVGQSGASGGRGFGAGQAGEIPANPAALPGAMPELNPGMMRIGNPARLIKAAYVGIDAAPAGAALDSQLKLPRDTGLLVNYVDPEGPAKAAGIQKNDVLTRFNDQLLIDVRQLVVLVRAARPGDEIKFTVIHEGQEQVISLKPIERQVYDLDLQINAAWQMIPQEENLMSPQPPVGIGAVPQGPTDFMVTHDGRTAHLHTDAGGLTMTITENGQSKEYKAASVADFQKNDPEGYKLYMEFFSQAAAMPIPIPDSQRDLYIVRIHSGEDGLELPRDVASQESSFSDGITLKLIHESDGKGLHLLARDKEGKVLFDGPITTPQQRKTLPAEVKAKLDSLSHSRAETSGSEIPIRIDND